MVEKVFLALYKKYGDGLFKLFVKDLPNELVTQIRNKLVKLKEENKQNEM